MTEIWKDVVGYEGLYQVSNLGRVKSIRKDKIMSTPLNAKDGYLRVNLKKNGTQKQTLVHRLVEESFVENKNGFTQVNHIDEDKTNNCETNLEWCTAKYNSNYGTHMRRIIDKLSKPVLCVELGKVFKNSVEAARCIGAAKGTATHINRCATGKEKSCYGYTWRYI